MHVLRPGARRKSQEEEEAVNPAKIHAAILNPRRRAVKAGLTDGLLPGLIAFNFVLTIEDIRLCLGVLNRAKFLFILALSAVAAGRAAANAQEAPPAGIDLRQWKWSGALSLNYRNIGAKPIEIEIEIQLLLTDLFFR